MLRLICAALLTVVACSSGSHSTKSTAGDAVTRDPSAQIEKEIAHIKQLATEARARGDQNRLACISDIRDRAVDAREYGQESGEYHHALGEVRRLAKQADACGRATGG